MNFPDPGKAEFPVAEGKNVLQIMVLYQHSGRASAFQKEEGPPQCVWPRMATHIEELVRHPWLR